ncbi:acireductone synthase [Sphingomonas flavalba]|uniref:acireductone synthase n=1 Tax=Sphingomonas flavalba TaxID=2559804 RepID=UPI00109E0A08|nr:acireductone synthase [Sphingomonas flavalba]
MPIRAILTDIEGTTSSIAFVADTLFPYARARIDNFIAAHPAETAALLEGIDAATLKRWIDEDRKEPALKTLQGMIWAEGYRTGELVGHVYPDAAEALRRWHAAGLVLAVFSSGSVAAQKLIFGHSSAGDLTPLFSGWFDLATGPKREAGSYTKIAAALGFPPADILFLSDVAAETGAAAAAGLATRLIDRAAGDSFATIAP